MVYKVNVKVSLKEGIMDPEAKTIERSLKRLGFDIEDLKREENFTLKLNADNKRNAKEKAQEMCERLLANPSIHKYRVSVE